MCARFFLQTRISKQFVSSLAFCLHMCQCLTAVDDVLFL